MIGIFDSGSGGLSVFREIFKVLPSEKYVYFSDNAWCPYGEKSREFIIARAREISRMLIGKGCRAIVVACNTATAAAISTLRAEFDVPFIGMEPAIKPAANITRSRVVGVLATAGTLGARKYQDTRDRFADGVSVVEHVGKGFVELVENGILNGPEAERIVTDSLRPLLEAGADTIVLGCTHYPFLKDCIATCAGRIAPDLEVAIIDPAPAVARQLLRTLGTPDSPYGKDTETDEKIHGDKVVEEDAGVKDTETDEKPVELEGSCIQKADIELLSSGDMASLTRIYAIL